MPIGINVFLNNISCFVHSTVPGALGGEDAKDLDLAFKELGEIRKLFLKIDHKEIN